MEIELLFAGSRGSSHVVLEWLCFPREDIAPGSVLRILSHGSSCRQSSTSFSSPVVLLVHVFSLSIFWALRTCQVGHFDSHLFWFLIEFFNENLVLTGGRYITLQVCNAAFTISIETENISPPRSLFHA